MHTESQEDYFQKATQHYNHRSFEQCLQQLDRCVREAPSSMMLNNRAIANYRTGRHQQAFSDLEDSLKMDHLNFVAHFNLFSLFSLRDQLKEALQSLIRGVSSLHTLKCREEQMESHCLRALELSNNNKEAMVQHGMFLLDRKQLQQSVKMLRRALEYENGRENRKVLLEILKSLKGISGEELQKEQQKNISGVSFQLDCSLNLSNPDEYPSLLQELLKEFNTLYWSLSSDESESGSKIKCSSFIDAQTLRKEQQQIGRDSKISHNRDEEGSVNKEEEETNLATTPNSLLVPDSMVCESKSELEKEPQRSTQNSIVPEEHNVANEPVESKQKEVKINFILYYAELKQQCKAAVYATLHYFDQKNSVFVSSLSSKHNQYEVWNEISQQFVLAPNPSALSLKLYSKDYTRFRDELIGQALINVGQLGAGTVPLLDMRNRESGSLTLGVSLSQ